MESSLDTCRLDAATEPWPGFNADARLTVTAAWGPRKEEPRQIANRWLDLFPRLATIHPAFRDWWDWIDLTSIVPLPVEHAVIEERVFRAAYASTPKLKPSVTGYHLRARNTLQEEWGTRSVLVDALIGSGVEHFGRDVRIKTDLGMVPDPDVFNFQSLRAMLLVLAEVFDADCGSVDRSDLGRLALNYETGDTHISPAWLAYVAPRFVPLVTPPPTATVEIRPDGGLLMAATTGLLDIGDPAHVQAAFDIAAGCRALRRFGR